MGPKSWREGALGRTLELGEVVRGRAPTTFGPFGHYVWVVLKTPAIINMPCELSATLERNGLFCSIASREGALGRTLELEEVVRRRAPTTFGPFGHYFWCFDDSSSNKHAL